MSYYANYMNAYSNVYGYTPVISLDIGLPMSDSIGLASAIPTRRITYFHSGPPTIIYDPVVPLPGVITSNAAWGNYGYGL